MTDHPNIHAAIAAVQPARKAVERHQREVLDAAGLTPEHIAENNRLNDLAAIADYAVAGFEVSNLPDLVTKLDYMVTHEMGDGMDWLGELLADVRRITCEDIDLERLWQERRTALAEYDADDEALEDEAINRSYWDRIEAAEDGIVAHPSTSQRAAEMRLWIALFHGSGSHVTRIGGPVATAIEQGETGPLIAAYAELDFHEQAILIAILNLRGENL